MEYELADILLAIDRNRRERLPRLRVRPPFSVRRERNEFHDKFVVMAVQGHRNKRRRKVQAWWVPRKTTERRQAVHLHLPPMTVPAGESARTETVL